MKETRHRLRWFISFLLASFAIITLASPAFAVTTPTPSNQQSIPDGPTSTCLSPPQNTDLTQLSDQQLQSYGLPTHTMINANPTFWHDALLHVKQRTCATKTTAVKNGFKSIPPARRQTSASVIPNYGGSYADHWADYEATGGRGEYKAATAIFNVPFIITTNYSNAVAVWAGVGGDVSNAVLPQVGIISTAQPGGVQYNESWWEVAGIQSDKGGTNLPLSRLSNGDRVYAYVSSNIENNQDNFFYIENETVGNYDSYTQTPQNTSNIAYSDSATGECVVERPYQLNSNGSGYFMGLVQFNPNAGSTIEIDDCEIQDYNTNQNSVGYWPHLSYTMRVQANGDILATLGPLTAYGQDFLVYWKATG